MFFSTWEGLQWDEANGIGTVAGGTAEIGTVAKGRAKPCGSSELDLPTLTPPLHICFTLTSSSLRTCCKTAFSPPPPAAEPWVHRVGSAWPLHLPARHPPPCALSARHNPGSGPHTCPAAPLSCPQGAREATEGQWLTQALCIVTKRLYLAQRLNPAPCTMTKRPVL